MTLTEEGLIHIDGFASRWVRLPSGVKAHYMTAGDTGPAVVLLHGGIVGSSGLAGWRYMAPFLAQNGFRVYCPDQPTFGLTEDPTDFYARGLGGHVDFLHDFTTALCLDRFHLSGNSMGAMNTVQYIVAHPDRVISFALIAGGIGDIISDTEVQEIWEGANGATKPNTGKAPNSSFDGTKESMAEMMSHVIYRQEAISDDLLEMRTRSANVHLQAWRDHSARAFGPQTGTDAVRHSTKGRFDELNIPGIYLYGRQDTLMPVEYGMIQEDRLPNVQFFYPDQCGHQGQTDQPEMFNQVFLEFFRDGTVSRATADWAGVSDRRPTISALVSNS